MKNIPEKIYLQVGDECPDDIDFNELSLEDVTWSIDKINNNDICYVLDEKSENLNKRYKKNNLSWINKLITGDHIRWKVDAFDYKKGNVIPIKSKYDNYSKKIELNDGKIIKKECIEHLTEPVKITKKRL